MQSATTKLPLAGQAGAEPSAAPAGHRIDDGVDAVLPARRLVPLALQHVLVMYAGAVAVPLVVGRALDLPPAQLGLLISADLVACGFATLIQTLGLPLVGIRLPIVMGVTNADGRCPELAALRLSPGRHALCFATADYFRTAGVALADPPFIDG